MTSGTLDLWESISRPSTLARDLWGWTGSEVRHGTYAGLFDSSRKAAAALRRLGVERGEIVAAVITNSHDAIAGLMGAWFAGACVASLPVVARGMSVSHYVAQLRRLVLELDARILLAEGRFLELLPIEEGLGAELVSYESLVERDERAELEPLGREDVIFIQYSSGSTGEPKGAMLSLDAIENQLMHLAEAMEIDPERDIGMTWLPMSHDMGLFGCTLLAWSAGMRGFRSAPERFIMAPRTWLEDCAAVHATVTAAPPLALKVAAKAAAGHMSTPLSIRTWLIGADQIDWGDLTRSVDALEYLGVGFESITTAYGLAEATLAVTLGDLRQAPHTLDVDGQALMAGDVESTGPDDPRALRLVSAGRPIRDVDVRIDSGDLGEICIRTSSLAVGYHHNDEATARAFRDGELRTGDIGLMVDGELYVVGRSDDVIVVGGRNIRVHDIEATLSTQPGVRPGNCALIDPRNGSGSIAIVAEIDDGLKDLSTLAKALHQSALELAGVPVTECLFVPKGCFPKTPSGKIQRFRCRALLAEDGVGVRVAAGRSVGPNR